MSNPVLKVLGRPVYYFCVPGDPLPKARTTQRGKWLDAKARRSLDYQNKVAQYARLVWRVPPFETNTPVEIKCFFYRKDNREVDRDNLVKSIQDGIQHAGIVRKDVSIIRGSDVLVKRVAQPHAKVFLCNAEPGGSLLALLGEDPTPALTACRAFRRIIHRLTVKQI